MAVPEHDDPEVAELTAAVRDIVGMAYRLTRDIDRTVDDLREFVPRVINRRTSMDATYKGEERRR